MYGMVCTRLDLAQVVNAVSRYMGKPGKEHRQEIKRIFRYLKGTTDIGLICQGYLDSNYVANLDAK